MGPYMCRDCMCVRRLEVSVGYFPYGSPICFNVLYVPVCVYAGVHWGVVVPTVARKECHNPWSWNYRRLRALCGYWELNWVLWKSI